MKYRYPNSGPALQLSDFAITTEPPTTLRVNIFILLVAGRSREYRCVSGSADRPLSQSQSHHRYSGTAGTGTLYLSSLAGAYRTRYGARAGVAVLQIYTRSDRHDFAVKVCFIFGSFACSINIWIYRTREKRFFLLFENIYRYRTGLSVLRNFIKISYYPDKGTS